MTKQEIKKVIKEIIDYPPKGNSRRTKDGYPLELICDEFAYKRMVNTYRDALGNLLRKIK